MAEGAAHLCFALERVLPYRTRLMTFLMVFAGARERPALIHCGRLRMTGPSSAAQQSPEPDDMKGEGL